MKEYRDKVPTIVIGGRVGSFLGEYLAGGIIVVLGMDTDDVPVGNFTGTGMHGGRIFIRTERELQRLPSQVTEEIATEAELQEIAPIIKEFAEYFEIKSEGFLEDRFYVLKPNAKNPYKQLYTAH
jgi:glutamate synthase domain-containing protein 3